MSACQRVVDGFIAIRQLVGFDRSSCVLRWLVRRRAVARRLKTAGELEKLRVLQILKSAGAADVEWAVWTGDSAMLTLVREELKQADADLGLGATLGAIGGEGVPARRLAQDVRCGSRSLLQKLQGER